MNNMRKYVFLSISIIILASCKKDSLNKYFIHDRTVYIDSEKEFHVILNVNGEASNLRLNGIEKDINSTLIIKGGEYIEYKNNGFSYISLGMNKCIDFNTLTIIESDEIDTGNNRKIKIKSRNEWFIN